jgi:hypothetical protein
MRLAALRLLAVQGCAACISAFARSAQACMPVLFRKQTACRQDFLPHSCRTHSVKRSKFAF